MLFKTIIQLTDLHFSIQNEKSIQSLTKTLGHLKKQNADLVIITGDITDLNDADSYKYFLKAYQESTNIPLILTAGNHDNTQKMQRLFGSEILASQVLLDNWLILILDSSVDSEDHGSIAKEDLSQIQSQMEQLTEHNILIFLHHHLLPVNSAWLDKYILENTSSLVEIINPYKERIHGVFHGHIHQPSQHVLDGINIYGTPSTSSQYQPNNDQAILISHDSYYRTIHIYENGTIDTALVFIP